MKHSWLGKHHLYLDEVHVTSVGHVTIGCYGGHTGAGSCKNEDGAFVLVEPQRQWVFTMVLDAHNSAESAEWLLEAVEQRKDQLLSLLNSEYAFTRLEPFFVDLFQSEASLDAYSKMNGETACILIYQRGSYVWWLSVGDCAAYVLHPEMKRLGQYALNQRQFFEWVGHVNSFSLPVPCYTVGRRQLRKGRNEIVVLTDGVLDAADHYFANPNHIYEAFYQERPASVGVNEVLQYVYRVAGKDSATVVCWSYHSEEEGLIPSDQMKK
ncbi:protein phosphatase 2C domain-containing protein [Paenibacillus sp. SC116]|uniref:protein phosphatase 2C domain-containing protein n=1 Tax=Paenibacillus sp. SC116 TaxID=2968986 RepID=UPI00215A12C3|nr:protein phosphatase 2C domain-containing protein [Paenibacillus sp. SC116]MCR8845888.1 protein phosphatase 2C domain-containing protein [Paenibacillus sp. SC116]